MVLLLTGAFPEVAALWQRVPVPLLLGVVLSLLFMIVFLLVYGMIWAPPVRVRINRSIVFVGTLAGISLGLGNVGVPSEIALSSDPPRMVWSWVAREVAFDPIWVVVAAIFGYVLLTVAYIVNGQLERTSERQRR